MPDTTRLPGRVLSPGHSYGAAAAQLCSSPLVLATGTPACRARHGPPDRCQGPSARTPSVLPPPRPGGPALADRSAEHRLLQQGGWPPPVPLTAWRRACHVAGTVNACHTHHLLPPLL